MQLLGLRATCERDKWKHNRRNQLHSNNNVYLGKPRREKPAIKDPWITIWPNPAKLTNQVSLTPAHYGTLQWSHTSLCKGFIKCKCLKYIKGYFPMHGDWISFSPSLSKSHTMLLSSYLLSFLSHCCRW